jgi:prephenate dehydratase
MMTVAPGDTEYDAAFQGERGAYSEAAAAQFLGAGRRLLPSHSLDDLFAAVAGGRARFGVVPLENTIAGTVPGVFERLLSHDVHVIAETRVAIDHALIGTPTMAAADVRRVLSHPVALDQCRDYLRRHPRIEPVAAFDTAGAVAIVMRENDGMTAAIAGEHAAATYGGKVLATHLQDHRENWTRFGLLARQADPALTGAASKVLLVFDLLHQPGALASALQPAAERQVNLTKIESRPISTRPFEYRFIVELTGGEAGSVEEVVSAMRERTASLRVLGRYQPV